MNSKAHDYSIIIATFLDLALAKRVARLLVEKRLAACTQLFPIDSVYLWRGKIHDEGEVMMFVKSRAALFDKVAEVIRENHSYEVPEIVEIPITAGLPEYLKWIGDCTE